MLPWQATSPQSVIPARATLSLACEALYSGRPITGRHSQTHCNGQLLSRQRGRTFFLGSWWIRSGQTHCTAVHCNAASLIIFGCMLRRQGLHPTLNRSIRNSYLSFATKSFDSVARFRQQTQARGRSRMIALITTMMRTRIAILLSRESRTIRVQIAADIPFDRCYMSTRSQDSKHKEPRATQDTCIPPSRDSWLPYSNHNAPRAFSAAMTRMPFAEKVPGSGTTTNRLHSKGGCVHIKDGTIELQ